MGLTILYFDNSLEKFRKILGKRDKCTPKFKFGRENTDPIKGDILNSWKMFLEIRG